MVFLFLGLPCTGKTTCAKSLAQTFGHYVDLDLGKAGREFPLDKLHASTRSIVSTALELSENLSKPIFIDSHCGIFSNDTLVEFCLNGGCIVWGLPFSTDLDMLLDLSRKRGDSAEFTDSYKNNFHTWRHSQVTNFNAVYKAVRLAKDGLYAEKHIMNVTSFIDLLTAVKIRWGVRHDCDPALPESGKWNKYLFYESVQLENLSFHSDTIDDSLKRLQHSEEVDEWNAEYLAWALVTQRLRYSMEKEVK